MIDKVLYIGRISGCYACKQLHPKLKAKCESANIHLVTEYLEDDAGWDYAELYGIKSVPTVIAFYDNSEVRRYTGTMTDSEIDSFLEL